MAPPPNQERRRAIADSSTALPAGTTANYFRTRDGLLQAAAVRVLELHRADMETAHAAFTGSLDRDGLIDLIALSLEVSATVFRERYLAVYELTLEATRRPALQQTFDTMHAEATEFTAAQHRALGLTTSREDVATLITLFGGALYTLVTGQAGPVTAEAAKSLATAMVAGIGPV
jgi:hypothetical protein